MSSVWKYFHILCTVLNRCNGSESLDEVQLLPIPEMKRCRSLVSLGDRTTDPRPTRDSKYCRWNEERLNFMISEKKVTQTSTTKPSLTFPSMKRSNTRVTGHHWGFLQLLLLLQSEDKIHFLIPKLSNNNLSLTPGVDPSGSSGLCSQLSANRAAR